MSNIVAANKFGAEVAKKKSIPNLDPDFLVPTAGGQSISIADISKKPYQYHVWIYASAKVIADNIKWLPKITEDKNGGNIDYENDLLDVFKSPNPWMPSSVTFWEAVILGLLLPSTRADNKKEDTGGQVFLVGVDYSGNPVDFAKGEIPDLIFPYTDSVIRAREVKCKGGTRLDGWDYVNPVNGKTELQFTLEEVIRIHLYNPYDWLSGLSPFVPAQFAMSEDIKSDIYNAQSFENDGTVAGVLQTELDLNDTQYRQNYKRWNERHGGSGRNNTVAILGNGLKYQQFGLSHVDMQFTEQKQFNFEKFAAAYKLNKIAYGKYENINFATIKEGRKLLWQDTYRPLDQLITVSIQNQWCNNWNNGNQIFRSDYTNVDELRPNYSTASKNAKTMTEMGLPAWRAFQLNDIPLTGQDLSDYPWLNEQPIQKTAAPPMPEKSINVTKSLQKEMLSEEEKAAISLDYIKRVLDPGEKKWRDAMDKFFVSQRNQMQDLVDKWLKNQKAIPTEIDKSVYLIAYWKQLNIDPSAFLLEPTGENKKLEKVFRPLVKDQLIRETARLKEELGALISFNVDEDMIDDMVKARIEDIKQINTTTFKMANKKIGLAIEQAIKDNDTPQEAAKKIKEAISDVGEVRKNQSMTIARTETGTISSSTRFQAFRIEGIEYTEWLTAGDEKVRDSHVIAGNSGPVEIGGNFPAVNMRFPLDPKGLPGDIINCRCVAVAAKAPKG